jgi:hypothetical protein
MSAADWVSNVGTASAGLLMASQVRAPAGDAIRREKEVARATVTHMPQPPQCGLARRAGAAPSLQPRRCGLVHALRMQRHRCSHHGAPLRAVRVQHLCSHRSAPCRAVRVKCYRCSHNHNTVATPTFPPYAPSHLSTTRPDPQLPAMYNVVFRKASMERLSAMPTIGQAANFLSWTVYAIVQGDPNILRVNVIGCGFSLLYLIIFAVWSRGEGRVSFLRLLALFVVVNAVVFWSVLGSAMEKSRQIDVLGGYAVGCNVIMYAFPLAAIRIALKAMDPTAIPLLLTLTGTATSILWLSYGLMVGNWTVAGPNCAGVGLNIVQLAIGGYVTLHARGRSGSADGADGSSSTKKRLSGDGDGEGESEYARLTAAGDGGGLA